jgi:glycerophosphoryl diester phosphodiesterase
VVYPEKLKVSQLLKLPIVFAHRGANSFAPENSLSAFRKAIQIGCNGIELDVRLCASGELVVFHDKSTLRMTGVRGNIHRLPYSALKELRLINPPGFSEKIPLLEEVLTLASDRILINIDVKKDPFHRNDMEEKIVRILAAHNLEENIIVSSFNPFVLKKISALNPRLHLGYIFRNRSSMMILNGHPVQSLHARYHILNPRYIRNLSQKASIIYAWTVDNENLMSDLIHRGISGIITNKPELFMKIKNTILTDTEYKNIFEATGG